PCFLLSFIILDAEPLPLLFGIGCRPGNFFIAPQLDNESLGHKLPDVFHPVAAVFVIFWKPLHYLAMAVGASDHNHVSAAVPDGIIFLASVPRRFIRIRTWPHSATRPTAVTVAAIWLHFDEAIHTLVDDPSRLLIKTLAEVALEFSSVFTGVMPGEGFSRVQTLVQLYPA